VLPAAKRREAGEQALVFAAVGRLRVGEGGFFQANALADQPTAEAMPDHQQAFHQKVVRVPEGRVIHGQACPVAFTAEANARRVGEQAVEQATAGQGFFQRAAMDDGVAHHGEGAALAALAAEAHVFVVEGFPQQLHQTGELLGGDARARLVQQGRLDVQLTQQGRAVLALTLGAAQGSADEMTGDGAFAHDGSR